VPVFRREVYVEIQQDRDDDTDDRGEVDVALNGLRDTG
jgi:sRNA-binding carbon storage regulator CsrA